MEELVNQIAQPAPLLDPSDPASDRILSARSSSDVNAVFLRALLLSLNLMVLPLVALTVYNRGGRIAAKSAVILTETLFDKGESNIIVALLPLLHWCTWTRVASVSY